MFKNLFFTALAMLLFSCSETKPKPKGELRLDYPTPKYQLYTSNCPYSFEYSDYAQMFNSKKDCWYNIAYPHMKGNIFITYYPIKNDFKLHLKEAERMVYEHTIKASEIKTKSFSYPEKKVYGNFYELEGQSASNIQFYVTDNTKHFLTGNLYFKSRPKPDSLAPAVDYVKRDILHMIETFQWK